MNVIFSVTINEDGLLELQTGYLNDKGSYASLEEMLYKAKRLVVSARTGSKSSSSEIALCTTIDDSYEPPPILGVDERRTS